MPTRRMEWNKLLSSTRLAPLPKLAGSKSNRTEFERDVDRIIFSSSFRRLSRKTQVHPLAANDHVHTRLTHSMEVSLVGRTLGKSVGKLIQRDLPRNRTPDDIGTIVQAACLAHDLGNPPFGHAGEKAMKHWLTKNGPGLFSSMSQEHLNDITSCEGNAQGFRAITQLENHLFKGGLRLTYATLGAYLKYPWCSRIPDKKFSAYISEEKILEEVASKLGLLRSMRERRKHEMTRFEWCRHPLAFLVEAADDICYSVMDIEDAVELRILQFDNVWDILKKYFTKQEQNEIEESFTSKSSFRVNLARVRGRVFDKAVSGAIDGFDNGYDKIMHGKHNGDLFDLLPSKDKRKMLVRELKKLAESQVFPDPKKIELELGCYSTFETLLDAFSKAAIDRSQELRSKKDEISISWKSDLVLKLLGDHAPKFGAPVPDDIWTEYQCLRRTLDFITGMTDNYATYISRQLQGMGFSGLQRP